MAHNVGNPFNLIVIQRGVLASSSIKRPACSFFLPRQRIYTTSSKQIRSKMKDNNTALYPNEEVAHKVSDYAATHSTKLPQHIRDHYAWDVRNQPSSNYMISPLQAQFLIFLAKSVGAKRST